MNNNESQFLRSLANHARDLSLSEGLSLVDEAKAAFTPATTITGLTITAEAVAFMKTGEKVKAIIRIREANPLPDGKQIDLLRAKTFVEAYMAILDQF